MAPKKGTEANRTSDNFHEMTKIKMQLPMHFAIDINLPYVEGSAKRKNKRYSVNINVETSDLSELVSTASLFSKTPVGVPSKKHIA